MSTLTYERAKQLYAPYDADQMRHLCALRDIEIERLRDENAKLREFASEAFSMAFNFYHGAGTAEDLRELEAEYHELGIEVSE